MKFFTEPNSDVNFKIDGNTELEADSYISIDLYVEPTKKKLINRNRFFYVLAEHPDIVWEIPILVIGESPRVYIPEQICLHKVPADTVSFYQFVIYNPFEKEISVNLCCNYDDFKLTPMAMDIPVKDYGKILITAKVPGKVFTTSVVVTVNDTFSNKICINSEPSEQLLYIGTCVLTFDDTYIGLKQEKNVYICNKSLETVNFQWTCSRPEENMQIEYVKNEELIVSKFLTIQYKGGILYPMGSVVSVITLSPPLPSQYEYNEEEEPPFPVNLPVYVFCSTRVPQTYQLQINANILGPNIEITPTQIDVGSIYMGQMMCFSFNVVNKGPIHGRVYFKGHTDVKEVRSSLTPTSQELVPGAVETVQLTFYRRDVGKFLTKLIFKISSGNSLPVLLRGTSLAVKVKIFPEVFEFGTIPICIPQKRAAMIANPLPVPIVVEPMVLDDGLEDPLILCVDHAKLPLHTRSEGYLNNEFFGDDVATDEQELRPTYSDFSSTINASLTSLTGDSQVSLIFRDEVLGKVPGMAKNLLQAAKHLHSHGEPETGQKIIEAALDCILDQSDYFCGLKEQQNYLKMDWQALPNDAREVAIEAEQFYLQPNESKSFPVVLVPNSCGPANKIVQFKVCPIGIQQSELKTAVRSKYMVNGLRLQYKCIAPVVEINDCIKFMKPLYVDMRKTFPMKFTNVDVVPGFITFKVLPKSKNGEMDVEKSHRKFFIDTDGTVEIPCSVIFRQVGNIILHGLLNLLGKILEYPFTIEAEVIPPKIQIIPEKLTYKQRVLEWTRMRIFIKNACPTVAKFTLSLKNENYQYLEPLGGSLAPKQIVLITVFSKFFDSGVYKNTIFVHLVHAETQVIPLTFIVEGIPIKFEPDITQGIDCGNIFRNDGVEDHLVKIKNYGEKAYRLLFKKNKIKTNLFVPVAAFTIIPNTATICPSREVPINIALNTSREGSFDEEYWVDGMDEDNVRFRFFTFNAKTIVIKSKVVWSKCGICFEAEGPDMPYKKLSDTVSLTNTTPLAVNVSLAVIGLFGIFEANELQNTLEFCLEGKAAKHLTIYFKNEEVEEKKVLLCFDGVIKCKVNNKAQKCFGLHAKIVNPGLKISTPEVTLFGENADTYAHILIQNCSQLEAKFTWKPLTQTISKTELSTSYRMASSKTISEVILNLPDELTPIFPIYIKSTQCCPPSACDELSCEEGVEEDDSAISHGSSLKLAKKASTESIKINTSKSLQPCRLLEDLNSSYDISRIGIKEVLKFLGYPEQDKSDSVNRDLELDMGDRNMESKDKEKDDCGPIIFQQKCGSILPGATFKAYMFLPPIKEGHTLNSRFDLEVTDGLTETLDVAITSTKGRVQISKTNIDLGTQVWYKIMPGKLEITNNCTHAVKISLIETADNTKPDCYFISGYVELNSPKTLMLKSAETAIMEWKTLLGFRQTFLQDIGIEVNNNVTAVPIRFHGTAFIPMIAPKNLIKVEPTFKDLAASYLSIREAYEDFRNKKNIRDESLTNESLLSSASLMPGEEGERSKRGPFDKFVALNCSKEIHPSAVEIERFIETRRFLSDLDESEELRVKFQNFYKKVLFYKATEFDPVINLKLFICRPIPWEMSTFILNMGVVAVNETKTLEVRLEFIGPGRVFLSARTVVPIPGLTAWFDDFQNIGSSNLFTLFMQSPDENALKRYENCNERDENYYKTESQKELELQHAHSYDFDDKKVHKRENSSAKAKKIKDRYTKLNQPFKEKKDPLILAEICQTNNEKWNNITFKLNLMFTPINEFYRDNQAIEDKLFIDVHLGPTVPILLKGHVADIEGSED